MFDRKQVVINDVTIYLRKDRLSYYFAESYLLLRNHLSHLQSSYRKYTALGEEKRKPYFERLAGAFNQNIQNTIELVDALKENVSLDAIQQVVINPNDNVEMTLKDFVYLRRDWAYLPDGEEQLRNICDSIKEELSEIEFENENALFLGCGVGRVSIDLANLFDILYATDKSFSMIWHLKKLLHGESITFYNPQPKNVLNIDCVAQEYTAKIPPKVLDDVSDRVECFVSDVLDLPLTQQSINCIFSIYFTDVIALKLWFNQINKVLKSEGLFIHFGPLDYFFSDEREMYTAEEFMDFFVENGYEVLVNKVIETTHLKDPNSLVYKIYKNWFFIARKSSSAFNHVEINEEMVLKIRKPLPYQRKGTLQNGEIESNVILDLPTGTFEGASSVIEILKEIDGIRTYGEVLNNLGKKGFDLSNKNAVDNLIADFLKERIIEIVN